MMRWRDLEAIGVRTDWPRGDLVFAAPEHVHAIVRRAIHERVQLVTDPDGSQKRATRRTDGECDTCGDAMPKRLGWCCLCAAAAQVAHRDGYARQLHESAEGFRGRWVDKLALPPELPPVPTWTAPLPPPPAWPSRAA